MTPLAELVRLHTDPSGRVAVPVGAIHAANTVTRAEWKAIQEAAKLDALRTNAEAARRIREDRAALEFEMGRRR